jgi:transposase
MDWADFRIGRREMIHAFVMALGFSRAMYVEFVERCTFETFLDCHIHAFHFLGGVPAEVLYDNMKNVVVSRKGTTVRFNAEFVHFANHYGFTTRACPPYSPWVKG